MLGGFGTFGEIAVGELLAADEDRAKVVTLYLSTHGFTTGPAETPPDQYFEARVIGPLQFNRSLFSGARLGGPVLPGVGAIEIANSDGFLDSIIRDYAFDGRRVEVRMGGEGFALADFGTIFDGTAERVSVDEQTVRIEIRDIQHKLEIPIQPTLYAGSGAAEGGADIKGKPKPLAFGECLNIAPVAIDSANLVYQFHDGPAKAVDAVYDRGAALAFDADYADYAALIAAAIPGGQYGTALVAGLIRLGASPAGLVTVDVKGSNTAGLYVTSTADIVKRIAQDQAGLADGALDLGAFANLNTDNAAPVGIFIAAAPRTIGEVTEQLMTGLGGFFGFDRLGKMTVGVLKAPAGSPDALFTRRDVIEIESLRLGAELDPPNWRRRVGYQRNWTVQKDDLALSVSDARRQFLGEEFRIAVASDSTVKTKHLLATDPPVVRALFAAEADASAEAARLLALHKLDRQLFRVLLKTQPFVIDINDIVKLSYPRFGLESGRLFRVVALDEDATRNEVEILLYG